MTLQTRAETLLCTARLYRPARNTYQRLLNCSHYAHRRQGRAFYRQFVPRGALVFDVGANRGHMAEMFLELGARVVAVEPLPELVALMRRRYPSHRLTVEGVAIGREPGVVPIYRGVEDARSTLVDDPTRRAAGGAWNGSLDVQVTTLDALIERHGMPTFVKIDVEGFETDALAGLTRPVPALSLEFMCTAPDAARDCMARLLELAPYTFATAGEDLRMTGGWTGPEAIMERIARIGDQHPTAYGDIYARQ